MYLVSESVVYPLSVAVRASPGFATWGDANGWTLSTVAGSTWWGLDLGITGQKGPGVVYEQTFAAGAPITLYRRDPRHPLRECAIAESGVR